nr:putative reverse transcriptase domain-containing protein [Tanacetum cinerariifolium]
MSLASSTVTYTSVYTDSEPGRVFWGVDEELSDRGSPRVIVYRYDGIPMQPVAPPSLDYIPGPEHPPSPDFMLIPHLPVYVPYVPELKYPRDDDDDDDDVTGDEDEEPFEDEEEEHLDLADSLTVLIIDLVPSAKDTEAFKTDEAALTLYHQQLHMYYHLGGTRIPSPLLPPLPSSLHLPSPVPTSLPLLLSPLPPLPASLSIPSPVDHREDTFEAELPPPKRLCLTTLTSRYEVGEGSTDAPRPTRGHRADYGFIDMMDFKVRRQRAEEIGYCIRDVWVDPTETVEENNMPPKRTSVVVRAASAAALMTASVVEQLIKARVSAALTNHEALRNSTNGQGNESHNSKTGMRGTVRTLRECTYKHFLNCKPLTFKGTKGVNSHMKAVTQDVAYAMDWKTLRKMMTDKYFPRGKIKKLEIELWNLKVKGTDVASYTMRFQELELMCRRMFHEESDEVEKYVGGLPDMIRGNKRKMEFNVGNNQRYQQQNRRQNTGRAYTVRPGEKKEYTGSLPLWAFQERLPEVEEWKPSSQGNETRLNIILCTKTHKYLLKGHHVFLAHITTKETEDKLGEKRLEDVPIVRDFPEVFPKELSGLLLTRQVEFQINLMPGVAPVARAPYRLAPFEMKELSEQLQELSDKGFIRPTIPLEGLHIDDKLQSVEEPI